MMAQGCASSQGKLSTPGATLKHYEFSEIENLLEIEQRPVAVFFHTQWCNYCANMEQTTLQKESVVKLLNEKYYFISFDAEGKEDVRFRNHLFQYQPSGRNTGTHELALTLAKVDGELSYPTFIILNPINEIVFQHNAFLSDRALSRILEEGLH